MNIHSRTRTMSESGDWTSCALVKLFRWWSFPCTNHHVITSQTMLCLCWVFASSFAEYSSVCIKLPSSMHCTHIKELANLLHNLRTNNEQLLLVLHVLLDHQLLVQGGKKFSALNTATTVKFSATHSNLELWSKICIYGVQWQLWHFLSVDSEIHWFVNSTKSCQHLKGFFLYFLNLAM